MDFLVMVEAETTGAITSSLDMEPGTEIRGESLGFLGPCGPKVPVGCGFLLAAQTPLGA